MRNAMQDDYIVFPQEHEVDISDGIYSINFCQAMESSNSQMLIDVMNEDIESMNDNDVWDPTPLPKGVIPIGFI